MLIREATNQDFDAIWEIFHKVVQAGDTYSYAPETTQEEAYLYWMPPHKKTYIALMDDKIVGTYVLKPNQPKLGAHVANAGYMVHPDAQGLGIGRKMALHSIEEAKKQGCPLHAIQFGRELKSTCGSSLEKIGFSNYWNNTSRFSTSYSGAS